MKLITHFMAKSFHKISFFFYFFSMSYNCVDQKTRNTLFQHKKQNQAFANVLKWVIWKISQNSQENTHVFFSKKIACIQARSLLEIPTQVFSCEFCEVLGTLFVNGKSPWDWKIILKASNCYYLWHMSFALPNLQNIL